MWSVFLSPFPPLICHSALWSPSIFPSSICHSSQQIRPVSALLRKTTDSIKKLFLHTHTHTFTQTHTHIKWIPIFLCPRTNSIQCCFCFTTTVIFFPITLSVISQWGIFWFPLVLPFGLPADLSPSLTLSFPVFVLFLRSVALLSTCQRFLQSCNSVWCYFMSLPTTRTVNLRPPLIYCLFGCSWYFHESRGVFVCLV